MTEVPPTRLRDNGLIYAWDLDQTRIGLTDDDMLIVAGPRGVEHLAPIGRKVDTSIQGDI